ncbi:ATP-dependent DNA helicase RecG [Thermodesulfobacteriota bacterium]
MNSSTNSHLRKFQNLDIPISRLKGVGPSRVEMFAGKGLHTIFDLFYFIPVNYEDRTSFIDIDKTEEGVAALIKGKIVYGKEETFPRSKKRLFRIIIQNKHNKMELLWFHYRKAHLSAVIQSEDELIVYGTVRLNNGRKQMVHPEVTVSKGQDEKFQFAYYPVYSVIKGISGNLIRSLMEKALDTYLEYIADPVPKTVINKLGLPDLKQTIRDVHFPTEKLSFKILKSAGTKAHKRLIFDRFFFTMMAVALMKKYRQNRSAPRADIPKSFEKKLSEVFPFLLTSHQQKAIDDIRQDLTSGKQMHRLLMGDVGCGKTVVAVAAAYIIIRNNRQACIMVPTQVLGCQHMEYFSSLAEISGFKPVLLTGDLNRSDRKKIYAGIKSGKYNLIIGTHALIQERLSFKDLGLAIIDEQHRFGVRQRALISKKNGTPHLLVMSATPIPRTLAMTVYGDMEISIINEYPKGRTPIKTFLIDEQKKRWAFDTLKKRMSAGQQAFVICPVIEASEEKDLLSAIEMEDRLKKVLSPTFRIGLIHGRMDPSARSQVMDALYNNKIDLLVGTTVIEVGVHVPDATVMVIEQPERFGLAQLHQLRGRVGRGIDGGICLLILPENIPEKALERLKIFENVSDGFEIAQKDLELRGHGELTGMKQSGVGELDLSEIFGEPELLTAAKQEAENLIDSDPDLSRPEHIRLKNILEVMSGRDLDC